jgi:predicted RNA-binding Zn ribbon-like protein
VSAPQFTPGPWEWWDDGESLVRITEASEQKLVCKTALPSNARLIAAAPSLYEAVSVFVDRINSGDRADTDYVIRLMNEALAKARGEQ